MVFVLIFTITALLPLLIQVSLYRGLDQLEKLALPPAVAAVRRSAELLRSHLPRADEARAKDQAVRERIDRVRDWVDRAEKLVKKFDEFGGGWFGDKVDPDNVHKLLDLLESSEGRIVEAESTFRSKLDQARALSGSGPDGPRFLDARDRAGQARRLLLLFLPESRVRIENESIGSLLLGLNRGKRVYVPVILLLVYNMLRLGLTYYVSPLRDEEERSGHSPSRSAYLVWLYHVAHRLCGFLTLIALAAALIQFYRGMSAEVFVPRLVSPAPVPPRGLVSHFNPGELLRPSLTAGQP